MKIILKEAAKNKKVGFAGRALPLFLRSDLDKLAIIAHESQDKSILGLFEQLPSLEELRGAKVAAELPELPPVPKPKRKKSNGTKKSNSKPVEK